MLPTVQLEPANAQLQVNSIPRGANVTVNGRYRGQSPVNLSLSPDINYEIGMSKAGYGVAARKIRLQSAVVEGPASLLNESQGRELEFELRVRSSEATRKRSPDDEAG